MVAGDHRAMTFPTGESTMLTCKTLRSTFVTLTSRRGKLAPTPWAFPRFYLEASLTHIDFAGGPERLPFGASTERYRICYCDTKQSTNL